MPWDDAQVVVAHARTLRRAVNVCRAHTKVAVLTSPGAGPAELGLLLDGRAPHLRHLRGTRHRTRAGHRRSPPTRPPTTPGATPTSSSSSAAPPAPSAPSGGWIAGREPGHRAARLGAARRGVRRRASARASRSCCARPNSPGSGRASATWCGTSAAAAAPSPRRPPAPAPPSSRSTADPDACARTEAAARRFGVQLQIVRGTAPARPGGPARTRRRPGRRRGSGRRLRRRRPPPAAHRHARRDPRRGRTRRPRPDRARLRGRVRPHPVRRTRHQGLDGEGAERRVPAQRPLPDRTLTRAP